MWLRRGTTNFINLDHIDEIYVDGESYDKGTYSKNEIVLYYTINFCRNNQPYLVLYFSEDHYEDREKFLLDLHSAMELGCHVYTIDEEKYHIVNKGE